MTDLLKERLQDHVVIFDGATGTEFYKRNFFVNTSYESLNLTNPKVVGDIHRSYVEAGAEVVTTNSYGANRQKLARFGLAEKCVEINTAAVGLARSQCAENTLVAASLGPLGKEVASGQISFDEGVEILGEQIQALEAAGSDFLMFETLSSQIGTECAIAAVNRFGRLPFVFSFAVDRDLETVYGEPLSAILALLDRSERRPTAVGLNCDIGPEPMLDALEKLLPLSHYPVIVQPNAGVPKSVDNRMIYMCSPEYLTTYALRYANLGARGIGGCCGIGPEHIRDIARSITPLTRRAHLPPVEVVPAVEEQFEPIPPAERSALAAKLCRGEFVSSIEITPPRGFDLSSTIEKARVCKAAGIDAINLPDGPRASSRISPSVTANEIQKQAGIEVILHCCCRDKNLIGMQADLLGCAWEHINNILFITGDPPKLGDYPFASAVFDVDSIGILKFASRLNRGIDIGGKSLGAPTSFFCGAGADPNALDMERELRRLREKVEAGASFIITQPAFAVEPVLRLLEAMENFRVPVIAGIWPLASYRNAEFMKNEVPGVVVPDQIMTRMARAQSRDDQRRVGIDIARETVAALRDAIDGIQISAPFGNVNSAIEVAKN
ncbi:bifunctional homocysteine S-methyltransferase/methylenetetrahydrofolate reductase [Victivallis sp. Marseille-Q1083]|uniref:bifunctional homocysteine S-methyltransferase/methylenetetrahydrofolate reductase n=1 Tax=Victivallis sp. Marseille-Q1083 TaxID=2717288 RepID=UPI00158CF2BC|nr:bifunctional homocysteine S-methyltransferase/methylenetetrahydrofolate reductase [Victivallis sp. Marseille-Q1083]